MARDFSKELKEHHEKREENRQANEQAPEEERANWHSAAHRTANNKHREIVGDMADSHARTHRPVVIQTDTPSKTPENDNAPPPNDYPPKQLTYGQSRLEQSRAAANDNKPTEKGPEPEK